MEQISRGREAGYFRQGKEGVVPTSSAEASRRQAEREARKAGLTETPVEKKAMRMNWKEVRNQLMADIGALEASGSKDAKTEVALNEMRAKLKTAVSIVGRA